MLVCLSGRGDKDVAHVAAAAREPGVTAGPPVRPSLPASQVAELINGLGKALRAFHMYLPNNPIYQRATENLRAAFSPIWAVLDELVLTWSETDFVWEEQVVYHQPNKNESLAWGLFKDGMRSLTLRRGAEQEELTRFLEMINRARYLPADAGDDLLTLLWEQEFQYIQYQFVEFFGEGGGAMPEQTGSYPTGGDDAAGAAAPGTGGGGGPAQAQGRGGPGGVRLHALLPRRVRNPPGRAGSWRTSISRDVRTSALNVLFDLFELEGDRPDRGPRSSRSSSRLFPNLLNARDFRTAAAVLRETQAPRRPRQGPHPGGARAARGVRRQAQRAGDRVASCCSRWTRHRRSAARRTWRRCCASCGGRRSSRR